LIRALRMKAAARRATDLALSPMRGKGPKRHGIRIPSGGDDGEPDRLSPAEAPNPSRLRRAIVRDQAAGITARSSVKPPAPVHAV